MSSTILSQQLAGEATSMTSSSAEVNVKFTSTPSKPDLTTINLASRSLLRTMGSRLDETVAAPTSQFAKNQLLKMGWTPGTGLGKNRTGRVTHIRVQKRDDQAGLGTERAQEEARSFSETWWKDSIGATLAKLSASAPSSIKEKKRKIRKDFTDEDLFQATGGSRFGMRAAPTKRLAKWRRTDDIPFSPSLLSKKDKDCDKVTKQPMDCFDGESFENVEVSDELSRKEKKEKRENRKKDKKRKREKREKKTSSRKKKDIVSL